MLLAHAHLMETRIKPGQRGARIADLRPEALFAATLSMFVLEDLSPESTWEMSSGIEGRHSRGSLHYAGQAFDISARGLKIRLDDYADALGQALGDDFDVIAEGSHVHVEFQPKTPVNAWIA